MGFHFFGPNFSLDPSRRMILEHASWLSRALRRGHPHPRIPVRRVAEGGFAGLMATPQGRRRAAHWWESTLKQVPR